MSYGMMMALHIHIVLIISVYSLGTSVAQDINANSSRLPLPTLGYSTHGPTPTWASVTAAESSGQINENGQCSCIYPMSANACSERANYERLTSVSARVDTLTATVESYELSALQHRIVQLSAKMTQFQAHFSQQSIAVSVSEITQLKAELKAVRVLVSALSVNGTASVRIEKIRAELLAIDATLGTLRSKNPISQNHELIVELESLRARLTNCKSTATNESFTRFVGDSLPLNEPRKGRCDNIESISIGEPVTHFWWGGQASGTWYRDPMPLNNTKTKIYATVGSYVRNDRLSIFKNYSDLALGANIKYTGYLGARYGYGWVVYKGFLFYADTVNVKKYDLRTNKQVGILKLPHINTPYLGTLHTYVDLHVDEKGLWAVYRINNRETHLVISKINDNNMTVANTWYTGKTKESIRNVFVICGRMITLDHYDKVLHEHGASHYMYDTNVARGSHINLEVIQKFRGLYHVSYNPREKALFGWDNQHLVTYPVTIKYTYKQPPGTAAPQTNHTVPTNT